MCDVQVLAVPVLAAAEGELMPRTWSSVLARVGVKTGDGRILAEGGGTSRTLPRPLMFQRLTGEGHAGAELIGRIESIGFEYGMVTARGSLLDTVGYDVVEAIESGAVGPSVDLDDIEYVMDADENLVLTQWRVAGATVVSVPAFADVSITLDPMPAEAYVPEGYGDYDAYTASLASFALRAREEMAAAPVLPPLEWFLRPDVDGVTPLTVSDTGRIFGHIAPWDQCHVGLPGCVTAPRSLSGYSAFLVGEQHVREGGSVPVGALVTGPRHANPQDAFRAAQQHYDDLDAVVARVSCGEDEFGIWVAGWMVPGAAPARVEQFLASPVSGDWRRVGGSLELIAVCSVNAPGFPVPRARVSFAAEEQRSLIASFGVTAQQGEIEMAVRPSKADVLAARARWAAIEWNRKAGLL